MYIVYTSLLVQYWKTIDGTLTNFIPSANGFKNMIRLAIGETVVHILIICRESWQRSQPVYVLTLTADSGLWQYQGDSMGSLWQDEGNYTCGLWQLMVGPDKTRITTWEASNKIMASICADSDNWQCALTRPGQWHEKPLTRSWWLYVQTLTAENGLLHVQGNSMWSLWQDHGHYTDNWPWVLTRQADCTTCLCQMIHSAALVFLIT